MRIGHARQRYIEKRFSTDDEHEALRFRLRQPVRTHAMDDRAREVAVEDGADVD